MNEGELAAALGISRTPVREAINRLEKEGLVEIFPQRGAFVIQFSEEDVYELFLIRENLEGLAAHLAAEKMNRDQIWPRLESCVEGFRNPTAKKISSGMPGKISNFIRPSSCSPMPGG